MYDRLADAKQALADADAALAENPRDREVRQVYLDACDEKIAAHEARNDSRIRIRALGDGASEVLVDGVATLDIIRRRSHRDPDQRWISQTMAAKSRQAIARLIADREIADRERAKHYDPTI